MKGILLVSLFFLASAFVPGEGSVSIIVNSENKVTSLALTEVRIYWMRRPKKRWEGIDKSIKPVDRKGKCPEKEAFYANVLRMSVDNVESYFLAKQYQSGEAIPDQLGSDKEVIDFVGRELGAIGFVKSTSLTREVLEKVKVVFVLN